MRWVGVGGVSSSRARVLAMGWAFGATGWRRGRTADDLTGGDGPAGADVDGVSRVSDSRRERSRRSRRRDSETSANQRLTRCGKILIGIAFGSRAVGDGRTWRGRRSAPRAPHGSGDGADMCTRLGRSTGGSETRDSARAAARGGSKPTVGSVGTRGFDFGALRLYSPRPRAQDDTGVNPKTTNKTPV